MKRIKVNHLLALNNKRMVVVMKYRGQISGTNGGNEWHHQ